MKIEFSKLELWWKGLGNFFDYYPLYQQVYPDVTIEFYERKWFNPLRWMVAKNGIKKVYIDQ